MTDISKFMVMKRLFLLLAMALVAVGVFAQDLPEDGVKKVKQAVYLMHNGNLDNAIMLLNNVLETYPKSYDAKYELAIAYYMKEDYDTAMDICKKLQKHENVNASLYQLWGNAYDMKGERAKAVEMYDKGLKKFPNSGQLYLEKGNCAQLERDYLGALELYEKGIEVEPDFTSNYYRASQILAASSEPIFAILYATVYRLLDPNSDRSAEMGAMIYDIYKEHLVLENKGDSTLKAHATLTKKNNITLSMADLTSPGALLAKMSSFEVVYESGLLDSPALDTAIVNGRITFDDIIKIRGDAIDKYLERRKALAIIDSAENASSMPKDLVAVLLYEKKIKDAGYWRVYNAWLMGTSEFTGADEILGKEEEKFKEFAQWEGENLFIPSRDGLTLRK